MARTIVRGRYVIVAPKAEGSDVLQDGAVAFENGVIDDVGPFPEVQERHPGARVLGGPGYIVLPGLVNSHHHANGASSLHFGIQDGVLEPWIVRRMGMKRIDPYLNAAYSAIKALRSGTTTVMANHVPGAAATVADDAEAVMRAFDDAGMRACYSLSWRTQNLIVYQDDDEFLSTVPEDLAKDVKALLKGGELPPDVYFAFYDRLLSSLGESSKPRLRVGLSPSNIQWCSDESLRDVRSYVTDHGLVIHMHLLETFYQREYASRTYGKSAVAHLQDLGYLGPDVSLAHSVWLTDHDIDILAETGAQVCHNASSNLKLQSGIAPVARLQERGATVALGTDTMALNDDDDLFQDMRLVAQLHRGPGLASRPLTADEVLTMATVNGAVATGFGDTLGSLEPGRGADMVLLDVERLQRTGLDAVAGPVDAIVYLASGRDVDTVIIDGRVVVEGGRVFSLDEDDISQRFFDELMRQPTPDEQRQAEIAEALVPHVEDFYRDWPLPRTTPYNLYQSRV